MQREATERELRQAVVDAEIVAFGVHEARVLVAFQVIDHDTGDGIAAEQEARATRRHAEDVAVVELAGGVVAGDRVR